MAEDTPETVAIEKETATEETPDIESQVREAMRSRINHFKEQSDSLTFEGVRRQIEKDLGLEKFALDGHKRFVKQLLLEHLDTAAAADNNVTKGSEETGEGNVHSVKDEATEAHEELESKNNKEEPHSEDEEKMEDSPVMGLLTGKGKIKSETKESQPKKNEEALSESIVKKALWKRASYIRENSESITMAGLRRILEKDLKLKEKALDPYKKFISKQLDEVIKTKEVKKKTASRQKILNSEGSRKRKKPEKEMKVSGRKSTKAAKKDTEGTSESEDSGNASDNNHSQSSAEKPVKKKEASTPAYGKRVEHLKSVIKSCGMSVPPAIYKKVKQAPESKRESQLIKELEEILSREGLSSDPSEKEIKEVRKKKERARELEGIDMSNIVSSSRRRSTASYAPPPKPKLPVDSDQDDDSDEEDEDDEDDGDDNENDDDNNDDGDGSQSEEDLDDGLEEDSD